MDNKQKFKKSPDMVFRSIADEAVLVPVKRDVAELEKIYTLNEAAVRIWQLLDEKPSLAELCDEIAREFDAEGPAVRSDIESFLDLLLANHIIEKT